MRKLIRFLLAVPFTPIALLWMFLDWLYETEQDSAREWKRCITLRK